MDGCYTCKNAFYQKKLVEENHNLIYSFLHDNNLSIEEWYGIAAIGLCKAAKYYDPEKGKFSTIAYRCMLNEYRIELRKTFTLKHIPDAVISSYNKKIDDSNDHEIIDILVTDNDIINDVILKTIIEKFLETLNKKEYTIMTMYLQGYTQKEISKVIGTSQCNISRIIKKLLIKLGA